MEFVAGIVRNILFSKDDYYAFSMDMKESNPYCSRIVKARGSLAGLNLEVGAPLKILGKWGVHPKYGAQFEVETWVPWAEHPADALRFLRCCVSGFSEAVLNAISTAFVAEGLDPFEGLKKPDEHLDMGNEQISAAVLCWQRTLASRDLSRFLRRGGLGMYEVQEVLSRWGTDAPGILRENPYRLMEIGSFDFAKVDRIALSFGVELDDPRRLEGAVLWSLHQEARGSGHLFLRRGSIPQILSNFRRVAPFDTSSDPDFRQTFENLVQRGAAKLDPEAGLYLPSLYEYERRSAAVLAGLMRNPSTIKVPLESFLEDYQKSNGILLSEAQQDAVRNLLEHRVLVLTGLPGTGKTTATRAIVRLFEKSGLSFMLMAPTGIASKRLSSVTGYDAMTVHRALGYDGSDWYRNEKNPLTADAVVVDETSMVDQELAYRLLVSLRDDTVVVFVGDDAQLPSVGPGNVLRELVACQSVPSVRLTQIFRQSERGEIVINSHRINGGEKPILHDFRSKSEFRFIHMKDPEKIVSLIVQMAEKLKSKDANFQVLSPMYKGPVGVDVLNEALRERLNPDTSRAEWQHPVLRNVRFRVGDRLMVLRNDYRKGVYNGDVGKLHSIRRDGLRVKVHGAGDRGNDLLVDFSFDEAPDMLKLAYCITAHKCLHPDTLIDTPGGLLRIGDAPSRGRVLTPDGVRFYDERIDGFRELYEVSTQHGYRLRATVDHGIDVWDSTQGYVRKQVGDLREGDFVRLALATSACESHPETAVHLPPDPGADPRCNPYRVPSQISPELSEFLGYMVADGTLYRGGFRLLKRHLEVVDRFAELGTHLFGIAPRRGFKEGGYYAEFNSVPVATWLAEIEGLLPWQKRVPEVVLRSDPETRSLFLRALFEDGSVHLRSDGCLDHIELCSAYPDLLDTVRVMLLGSGVVCSTYSRPRKNPRLFIYGQYAVRFRDTIGLASAFKRNRLEAPAGKLTRYLVPITREELGTLADLLGGRRVLSHSDLNAYSRGYFSVHQLLDLLGRIPAGQNSHVLVGVLTRRATQFHHTRVSSVVSLGEHPTVCLHVPDGHQFVQDGFCAWNCQGSEFNTIIMPVVNAHGRMLQRNLLYTGVTRARKQVLLIGEESAVTRAVENNKVVQRNTALGRAIQGENDDDS